MSTQDQGTKRKAADEAVTKYIDSATTSATNGGAPAPNRAKKTVDTTTAKHRPMAKVTSRSHKKKVPAAKDPSDADTATPAPPVATGSGPTAPTRLHTINDQNLFILQTRANLVAGATGPKEWSIVTNEFNQNFSKSLAAKTVSKRGQVAKKVYLEINPGWADTLQYPVPLAAVQDEQVEDEGDEMDVGEQAAEPEDKPISDLASAHQGDILSTTVPEILLAQEDDVGEDMLTSNLASAPQQDVIGTEAPEPSVAQDDGTLQQILGTLQPIVEDHVSPPATAAAMDKLPPTATDALETIEENAPSQALSTVIETLSVPVTTTSSTVHFTDTISADQISPVDRAKFYLSGRTNDAVAFNFENHGEDYLEQESIRQVDNEILLVASPHYARFSREHPESPTLVPKQFTRKTVNAFMQLISPVRGTSLPTHYIWHSATPVPGVYDRFGAINSEKIFWTFETLLDLHAFARHMEVHLICDMVIDRLHTMFT